jgi:hypothetical protein
MCPKVGAKALQEDRVITSKGCSALAAHISAVMSTPEKLPVDIGKFHCSIRWQRFFLRNWWQFKRIVLRHGGRLRRFCFFQCGEFRVVVQLLRHPIGYYTEWTEQRAAFVAVEGHQISVFSTIGAV